MLFVPGQVVVGIDLLTHLGEGSPVPDGNSDSAKSSRGCKQQASAPETALLGYRRRLAGRFLFSHLVLSFPVNTLKTSQRHKS